MESLPAGRWRLHWVPVAGIGMSLLATIPHAVADEWDDAAEAVVRLEPRQFKRVPAAVIAALTREACSIPQATGFEAGPHNLIRGRFAATRQVDHAALCSKNGASRVVVIWGGPIRCPAFVEGAPDKNFLQTGAVGIDFSRAIFPATQKAIAYYQRRLGGPKPPDRGHEGIEDSFLGKVSEVLYCAGGRWHSLQGMD